MQKGPLVGSAWRDNRVVTALSTTSATDTRQKDGSRIPALLFFITSTWDQLRGCRIKSRTYKLYTRTSPPTAFEGSFAS